MKTRVGKDEFMESEIETKLAFLKDITPDGSSFENLKEVDPISPLEVDIGDYIHIEKEKWDIIGPQFNCAPIYDTDKEDETEVGFPFLLGYVFDDVSIDTLGKESYYFPLHEDGQLEVVNSPFSRDQIFNTKKIDEAPTYPPYESMFKSLEPLEYDFGEPIEYNVLPLPLLFPLVHHLESSSTESITPFHVVSSDHEPFPLLNMVSRKNPSLNILISFNTSTRL